MREKAFTLIELLVVIAIIGILASIIVISLSNSRMKARDAVRKSDMRTIKTEIADLYTDVGSFTTTGGTVVNLNAATTGLTDSYMKVVPDDPLSGASSGQHYLYISDGREFAIGAKLENLNDSSIIQNPTGLAASLFNAGANFIMTN